MVVTLLLLSHRLHLGFARVFPDSVLCPVSSSYLVVQIHVCM